MKNKKHICPTDGWRNITINKRNKINTNNKSIYLEQKYNWRKYSDWMCNWCYKRFRHSFRNKKYFGNAIKEEFTTINKLTKCVSKIIRNVDENMILSIHIQKKYYKILEE